MQNFLRFACRQESPAGTSGMPERPFSIHDSEEMIKRKANPVTGPMAALSLSIFLIR